MRDPIDDCQLYELSGQQSQRPSRTTFGRIPAGHRDEPRLARAVEFSPSRRFIPLLAIERPLQSLVDESLPDISHGVRADLERIRHPLIGSVRTVGVNL